MNDWSTPQEFFDLLNQEFRFDIDVCGSDWNHKCANYYTVEDDGLSQTWEGSIWMNPPYSECDRWIRKAYNEAVVNKTCFVVCLVPARTDTSWFHDCCLGSEIRFVRGRIHFSDRQNKSGRPRFSSMIVIMRSFVEP